MDGAPAWLEELNPQQRDAVLHRDGHLLVVAGAGSGKTRTLACRVASLVLDGVAPQRILLLTFTRRAARDMTGRVRLLTAQPGSGTATPSRDTRGVWGGTFHSVAVRLLRHHGAAAGLPPSFTILDQADGADLLGLVRTDLGFAERDKRFPKKDTLASIYSRVANTGHPLSQVLDDDFPWCRADAEDLGDLFAEATRRKRDHGVLDFDDLLLYWRALVTSDTFGPAIRSRFDHVLVDEYQDTNPVQADILEGLAAGGAQVTVVGDDAQAIYSFRAATVHNLLDFPDRFGGAAVVRLERNYRSTPQILDRCNAVMALARQGLPKTLWSDRPDGPTPQLATCSDEGTQAAYVCDHVLGYREQGIALRDQAVLFRIGHHSDGLELELSQRDIPYVKYGGLKFLEAAHVKDLLALLRVLDNPRDELAWQRTLGLLQGVGPVRARTVAEAIGVIGAATVPDPMAAFLELDLGLPQPAAGDLDALRDALTDCRGDGRTVPPPGVQIERLLPICAAAFARTYPDADVRLADLEQLRDLAADTATRTAFLAGLALDPPASTSDLAGPPHLDDDYLTLSTIHSAKGAEWRAVYVIHAADGNLPSDMSMGSIDGVEEERRLLYVAMTRARDHLHVSFPQRFYHRRRGVDDAHSYAQMSRFLTPIAAGFDAVTAGYGDEHGDASGPGGGPTAAPEVAAVDAALVDLFRS